MLIQSDPSAQDDNEPVERVSGGIWYLDGFSVVVVIIPWLTAEEEVFPQRTAHRIVELEAHRAGFETIDLTDQFMRVGVENLKMKTDDPIHPNQAGHATIADSLAKYVREHVKKRARGE